MTSFDAVEELDLRIPLSIQERGAMQIEETGSRDQVIHSRALSGRRARTWQLTIPASFTTARDRLLALHEISGYGTLPLRWTPPGESETTVFLNLVEGARTSETTSLVHELRFEVREVR